MNQRVKYLFKNLGILTISNFSSKIFVFLLVPIYTSALSTAEYGTYDLVVSTVSLLYPILTANITDAVMRFCMDKNYLKEEIATIGIRYVLFSIGVVGIFLFGIYWFEFFPNLDGIKVYIFIYYLSYVLNHFFIQFAKGLERVADMGIAGILGTVIMLGANVIFLLIFNLGLAGFFLANILAQIVPVLYYFFRLRFWKYIKGYNSNKGLEKQMLGYCVPLICTVLGWWVNSTSDRYMVTFMCGVAANGILSVSYKIPSIINALQTIFVQAWQISAIKEYGEKGIAFFYGKVFTYLNAMMSVACSCLIILCKPLAHILYANDFYVAWQYVPFLLISSVFNCAAGFIGPILSAKKDSKNMAISAVYGALSNIALNVVLVYVIGLQGATIATAVSSYIIYYYRKCAVKDELKLENYRRIIFTWILLCIQAVLEIYFSVWYLESAIVLLMWRINKDILVNAMKLLVKKK